MLCFSVMGLHDFSSNPNNEKLYKIYVEADYV